MRVAHIRLGVSRSGATAQSLVTKSPIAVKAGSDREWLPTAGQPPTGTPPTHRIPRKCGGFVSTPGRTRIPNLLIRSQHAASRVDNTSYQSLTIAYRQNSSGCPSAHISRTTLNVIERPPASSNRQSVPRPDYQAEYPLRSRNRVTVHDVSGVTSTAERTRDRRPICYRGRPGSVVSEAHGFGSACRQCCR
jgi:hypothetical protein